MGSLIEKIKKSVALTGVVTMPFLNGCSTPGETNFMGNAIETGSTLAVMNGADPTGGLLFGAVGRIFQGEAQIQAHEQTQAAIRQAQYAQQVQQHNESLKSNYDFKAQLEKWVDLNRNGKEDYETEFFSKPDANGRHPFTQRSVLIVDKYSEIPYFSVQSNCPEDYYIRWQYYKEGEDKVYGVGSVKVPGNSNTRWIYKMQGLDMNALMTKKFRVSFFIGSDLNARYLTTSHGVVEEKKIIDTHYSNK